VAGTSNVERTLGHILGKLEGIDDRLSRADESRAAVHRRLDDLVMRTTHVETDLLSLKRKVETVEAVTDDVKVMRERAFGAGTLGVWLWRVGSWVLSAAAGAAAVYTWMTGRPPP
jgi:hypothetical protein